MTYSKFASDILYITKKAGEVILHYYNQEVIEVETKDDKSPVTKADKAANALIKIALKELSPEIPIVSEEDANSHLLKINPDEHLFWLVDPIDGTKSFIKKKGEFTVNIGLIKNGKPIGGAIYVPVMDIAYFTAEDGNAYKQVKGGIPSEICVRKTPNSGATVVTSQSHLDENTELFINALPNLYQSLPAASSLKFCMIAEGKADLYPRFAPTMEWDTAAGHAILNAAGGLIINPETKKEMRYNKPDFRNHDFLGKGLG